MRLRLLAFASLLVLCSACVADEAIIDRPPFFSLTLFMDSEIERLEQLNPTLKKEISFNGQIEERELEEVDFTEELAIFRKADINRPAWLDLYTVDSVFTDGRLRELHYQTNDPELRTQQLSVYQDANQAVTKIEIKGLSSTVLSNGERYLTYEPSKGYEIRTLQQSRAAETVEIRITSTFE